MRIPILQREKVAIIMFRKKGHRINHISKAFNRSTSVIHNILSKVKRFNPSINFDLRKLPHNVKRYNSKIRLNLAYFYLKRYNAFMVGESEKPP